MRVDTASAYPKATDFFVCDDPEFARVYGARPRELDVVIPVDDVGTFAPQWMKRYGKTGLLCRGNGQTGMALVDTEKGGIREYEERGCKGCPHQSDKSCRPIMCLQVLLPRVKGIGVWQVDTSSINSIKNLNGSVAFIKAITGGRVASLPLVLRLVPTEKQIPGERGPMVKTIYVLELGFSGTYQELQRAALTPAEHIYLPEADEDVPTDLFSPEITGRTDNSVTVPALPPASPPAAKKAPRKAEAPQNGEDEKKAVVAEIIDFIDTQEAPDARAWVQDQLKAAGKDLLPDLPVEELRRIMGHLKDAF